MAKRFKLIDDIMLNDAKAGNNEKNCWTKWLRYKPEDNLVIFYQSVDFFIATNKRILQTKIMPRCMLDRNQTGYIDTKRWKSAVIIAKTWTGLTGDRLQTARATSQSD